MHLSREVEADVERIRYGLLACRCFEFPIVDGIPLLSLAAGFGGAQDELQPYVALQIAAIKHLQRNDVNGLRTWIARAMPLAAALMEGHFGSYLEYRAASDAQLDLAIVRHLARYEASGAGPPRKGWRNLARSVYHSLRGVAPPAVGHQPLDDFYTTRFFAPRQRAGLNLKNSADGVAVASCGLCAREPVESGDSARW
jgi:hypothetical protein